VVNNNKCQPLINRTSCGMQCQAGSPGWTTSRPRLMHLSKCTDVFGRHYGVMRLGLKSGFWEILIHGFAFSDPGRSFFTKNNLQNTVFCPDWAKQIHSPFHGAFIRNYLTLILQAKSQAIVRCTDPGKHFHGIPQGHILFQ